MPIDILSAPEVEPDRIELPSPAPALYDRIEQSAGGIALFMNGTLGGMVIADNRNLEAPPKDAPRAYRNDIGAWGECERIGRLLASESLRIIDSATWQ